MTNKAAAERAAVIRKQNVNRHQKAARVSKLRTEIQRPTADRNYNMELGRLQEACETCMSPLLEIPLARYMCSNLGPLSSLVRWSSYLVLDGLSLLLF